MNPSIHYNEWANFKKEDFAPVVEAYKALMAEFFCADAACQSMLYVVPERGARETLRCACNGTSINFKRRPREVRAKGAAAAQ
jgi:hypothetical protein